MVDGLHHLDRLRRLQGRLLDAARLGPVETPWRTVAQWPGVRLRAYGGPASGPPLLVVPAPIKRAYIWDLVPRVSAIRRLQALGLSVYLAEWTPPGRADRDRGLEDYADGILLRCVAALDDGDTPRRVLLAGHSLGGTLAAIFAARHPDRVGGLVLIEAPLRFGPGTGAFAPLVAAAPPAGLADGSTGTVPGSLLNTTSALAAPVTFLGEREADLLASLADPRALETHVRVRRWQLDEFPLPQRLFEDVVERLYRRDELMRGELLVGGERLSPQRLRAPLLAIVNPASRVIPPASVLPFQEASSSDRKRLLWYRGDRGVALQHVGALVGERAHRELWPQIGDWLGDVLDGDRAT